MPAFTFLFLEKKKSNKRKFKANPNAPHVLPASATYTLMVCKSFLLFGSDLVIKAKPLQGFGAEVCDATMLHKEQMPVTKFSSYEPSTMNHELNNQQPSTIYSSLLKAVCCPKNFTFATLKNMK